jgi:hypothetical protein
MSVDRRVGTPCPPNLCYTQIVDMPPLGGQRLPTLPKQASLTKFLARIPHPIRRVRARLHVSMKRRPRPIGDAGYVAVFQRVGMHVIHAPREISIIANRVFIEAALP